MEMIISLSTFYQGKLNINFYIPKVVNFNDIILNDYL